MTYSDEASKIAALVVLTEEDLPERFRSTTMYALPEPNFMKLGEDFGIWCIETHTFYYARSRESFHEGEARDLAVKARCTRLILEDMS